MDELTATWRHPEERAELVAQLVLANRRARVAEAKVRELLTADDRCTALATRVVELEDLAEQRVGSILSLGDRLTAATGEANRYKKANKELKEVIRRLNEQHRRNQRGT